MSYERYFSKISVVTWNDNADPKPDRKCPDAFPIFVGFVNGTPRTIEYISFELSAHLPNHSTDILEDHTVSLDFIVKPKEGFGDCFNPKIDDRYKMSPKVDKAEYAAKVSWFRFAESEEMKRSPEKYVIEPKKR